MSAMFIDLTLDSDSDELSKTASTTSTKTPSLPHSLAHRALNVPHSVPQKRKKSDTEDAFPALVVSSFVNGSKHREHDRRVASQPEPSRPSSRRSNASQEAQSQNRRHTPHALVPALRATRSNTPTSSSASTPEVIIPSNPPDVLIYTPSHRLKREASSFNSGHAAAAAATSSRSSRSSSLASSNPTTTQPPTALSQRYYPTDAYEKRAVKGAYPKAKRVQRSATPLVIGTPGPLLIRPPNIRQQTRKTMKRKLRGIKGPAVTYDAAAERRLADFILNFEFVNTNPLRKGVVPVAEEFNAGCTCEGVCDETTCLCLSKEEDESNTNIVPYRAAADVAGLMVLKPEFLTRKAMIYECSDRCSCDQTCWNRVVQNGRTVRLQIFHTGDRGFGLRSPDRIRPGQFIDCYQGEVITAAAATLREADHTARGTSYLFSLDFLNGQYEEFEDESNDDDDDGYHDEDNDDEDDEAESGCKYVIDGRNFGGVTRFINHSCNPNCRMIPVSRNHADRDLYDLAFFALREIPPFTELTFDYNPGSEGVRDSKIEPTAVRCLCGEANCRGQLWPNQRKKGTR